VGALDGEDRLSNDATQMPNVVADGGDGHEDSGGQDPNDDVAEENEGELVNTN